MKQMFFIIFILSFSSLFSHTFSEKGSDPWGVDAGISLKESHSHKLTTPQGIGQKICTGSIRFFQKYISDIDGPRSSFYPTSSEYTRQMICKYGVLQGIALGCDRLMRENKDKWVYRTVEKHGVLRKLDN